MLRRLLLFVLFLHGAAANAEGLPAGNGLAPKGFPESKLRSGVINGSGPASLLNYGEPDCPTGAGCPGRPITKPYLVAGEQVAITDDVPGYVYVVYPAPPRVYEGWLPSDRVKLQPDGLPTTLGSWEGLWDGDNSMNQRMDISKVIDKLHVVGSALNPHDDSEGNVSGTQTPQNNSVLIYDDGTWLGHGLSTSNDGCVVELLLLKAALLVIDSSSCDGANVSLSGVYVRE